MERFGIAITIFHTQDVAHTGIDLTNNVASILLGDRDLNLHNRFKDHGSSFFSGFANCQQGCGSEGHFA